MTDTGESECPSLADLDMLLAEHGTAEALDDHLASCGQCRSKVREIRDNNKLLGRLTRSGLSKADLQTHQPPPAAADLPGSMAGYDILEEIHRGGQGVVYRARQSATNRVVALKILLAGSLATSRQRQRFEREIEWVAQLEHPHIVTVYDSGTTAEGFYYVVMRYVDGVQLHQWTRHRCLAAPSERGSLMNELLSLFVKLCNGVSHAHQRGVIHRDLKPENILVDRSGQPHILDFGVAKAVDRVGGPPDPAVTSEGAFVGTLAYAAPEQIRGDPSLIDVRTDVYALGILLYQMMTGQFPYPVSGELDQMLQAIRSTEPTPPRHWTRVHKADVGGDLRPFKINHELDTIILKALAKDQDRRYQSAAALSDDVVRYLVAEPIEAKRDSTWYVFSKTIARHRLKVAVCLVFVVLLIGFSVTSLLLYRRARLEAAKSRLTNLFLEDTLASVESAAGGRDVSLRELLDEAVPWIDAVLGEEPEVQASIQSTIGNSYRALGHFAEAEALLQAALSTRQDLFGAQDPQVAESLSRLAQLRLDQGRFGQAERLWQQALVIQRQCRSGAARYTLASLALLNRDRQGYAEAERLLRESLDLRRRMYGATHSEVAMALHQLATVSEHKGDLQQAERLYRQALDMRRQVLVPRHSAIGDSLQVLAELLLRCDRAEQAEPLLRECLELRRQNLQAGHWQIAVTQCALGAALARLDRIQEAQSFLIEGYHRLSEAVGPDDARSRRAQRWLIGLYEASDQPKEMLHDPG